MRNGSSYTGIFTMKRICEENKIIPFCDNAFYMKHEEITYKTIACAMEVLKSLARVIPNTFITPLLSLNSNCRKSNLKMNTISGFIIR